MTGIILAGGRSSRMGKDKAQLPWKEGTLLTAVVDKLFLLCKEVVVVGPRRTLDRPVKWTEDRYCGKGPLAGIHAGLAVAAFDSAIILPCDMPTVPVQMLEAMVLLSKNADLVIPVHSEGYEPLCAWYSRDVCLPVISSLLESGYTSPLDILPRVRIGRLEVENLFSKTSLKRFFANLNSPIDYEIAKREAAAGTNCSEVTS